MTTLKFLVTINVDGTPPNKQEIRVIGMNVDMAIEMGDGNRWILPDGYDGEIAGYIVEVVE